MATKKSIIYISALLCSCAGINPNSLMLVTNDKSIELFQIQYEESYKISDNRVMYKIEGGRYTAKLQDSSGLFYEGPGKCLAVQIYPNSQAPLPPHSYRCLIYVPNEPSEDPKLYFYRDPEVSAAIFDNTEIQVMDAKGAPSTSVAASVGGAIGFALVRGLDAAELKNIHLFFEQPKPSQLKNSIQH